MSDLKNDDRVKLFEYINAMAPAEHKPKLVFNEDYEIMKATERNAPIVLLDENGAEIGLATNESVNNQLKFDVSSDGELSITEEYKKNNPDYDGTTPIWIYADPVIFDEKTKAQFLSLPVSERPRFTIEQIEKFYKSRPEYNTFARRTIYENPMALLNFFKGLTLEDFESCEISSAEERFIVLQSKIERLEKYIKDNSINTDRIKSVMQARSIMPILTLRELFLESEIAALYYLKNPTKSPKELAKEKGAIMTIGGRLADISNPDYSGWLDERPNKYAYISYTGDKHYFDRIKADPDGNLYEQLQRSVNEQDKRARKAIKDGRFYDKRPPEHEHINSAILQALLKVAYDNPRNDGDRYFYIHVPTLAKELNEHYITNLDEYDENGILKEEAERLRNEAAEKNKEAQEAGEKATYNPPNFLDLLTDLNYWVGVINNMPTQIISINQVDYKTNTIRIDIPFIYDAMRASDDKRHLDAEKRETKKINPGYNFLLHSSIAAEKDKIAVDLATTIINKILQRGSKNYNDEEAPEESENKIITLNVKYKDLIEETPALKMAYNGASAKYKYDVLSRKFKTAFKILKKRTDIYDYYIDLEIPNTPPTTKTLDNYLIIKHKGINKEYKIKH